MADDHANNSRKMLNTDSGELRKPAADLTFRLRYSANMMHKFSKASPRLDRLSDENKEGNGRGERI
jgi:hypothetical protein